MYATILSVTKLDIVCFLFDTTAGFRKIYICAPKYLFRVNLPSLSRGATMQFLSYIFFTFLFVFPHAVLAKEISDAQGTAGLEPEKLQQKTGIPAPTGQVTAEMIESVYGLAVEIHHINGYPVVVPSEAVAGISHKTL